MPYMVRPLRCSPVQCFVMYHAGLFQGQGVVWNLSLNGWKLSGDLRLRVGQTCSLTVNLPGYPKVFIASGIVRWVRDEEYGVETLIADQTAKEQLAQYITQQVQGKTRTHAQPETAGIPRGEQVPA